MSQPLWLDLQSEVPFDKWNPNGWINLSKKEKTIKGILISFKSLISSDVGLINKQALEIVANSTVETGWFENIPCFNFGGVKAKEEEYKRLTKLAGKCPPWWQKAGHIASGDQPTCYYKAYSSPEHFYKEWLERYVPNPSTVALTYRYAKCGEAFWKHQEWFPHLIEAGYKGEVTKKNPNPSIAAHNTITFKIKVLMTQKLLDVAPDGSWGSNSVKAAKKFKEDNNLVDTDSFSEEMFDLLIEKWKNNSCKIE